MRLLATIVIAAVALAAGCTSMGAKPARERDDRDRRQPDRRDPDQPWWTDSAGPTSRIKTKPLPDAVDRIDRETIVAGTVVDAPEHRPLKGRTYIIVRAVDEPAPAGTKGRNVGVETDDDGAFLIPFLTRGKTYILTAVREIDGRKIAAEMQVKPPAGNIRLELGENKVSSGTPGLPPPPGLGPFAPPGLPDSATTHAPAGPAGDRGWEPGATPPGGSLAPLPAGPSPRPENIAGTDPNVPPTAAIRPPPAPAPARKYEDPPPTPPVSRLPANRVPNFVVSDVTGGDWEFRYAQGRLILVDFWSTTCAPCMRAVPAIKRLQTDYGASGLEVVAIACEPDASLASRAKAVDEVARRKDVNYRVYLEREGKVGDVQRLFSVQWVPTLVLLDHQGTILWRGGATETDLTRLNDIVKAYLTKR